MKSFKLARTGGNKKIQYVYVCCKKTVKCNRRIMNNPLTNDGRGSLVYLDRQNVKCPNNGFLTQFKLNRNGNRYRYSYECCVAGGKKDVKSFSTNFNDDGGRGNGRVGNMLYMDRHNINCPQHYSLSQWKLRRNGAGNKIRFDFTCVKSILAPGKSPFLFEFMYTHLMSVLMAYEDSKLNFVNPC